MASDMSFADPSAPAAAGFSFENATRNPMIWAMQGTGQSSSLSLSSSSSSSSNHQSILPLAKKTGTTIVAVVYKDGVVLGADTRATSGSEVAEKNCEKIHYLAPNIMCCGAGTAADTEMITQMMASQLELLRMNTHSPSRIITACTLLKRRLYRYQGYISAALILGGCDLNGPAVYQIHPHGSTAKLNYTTMGSGSLAAMAVMESSWKEDMTEAEAVLLVQRSIGAGIFNDLGSGSNCDVCVIRMDGTKDYRRNDVKPNEVAPLRNQVRRSAVLQMHPGLTPTLGKTIIEPHPARVGLADIEVVRMEVETS